MMNIHAGRERTKLSYKILSAFIAFTFSFTSVVPPSYAQSLASLNLPVPGTMVAPSAAFVPVLLKGMTIYPNNPLQFDFIIDSGNTNFKEDQIKTESQRLVKYFLASMTIPKDDLWVNLSPYEKDRIIPDELGKTELGRDMLAQDYILKQLTASLMYPEKELGKEFWDKVYQKAQEKYGTTEIPVNTFNKVWILPETATVYEHGQTVYIVEAKLRVMLDADYLAMSHQSSDVSHQKKAESQNLTTEDRRLTTQIVKEIILPEIEKEVNEGQNFAPLRQIYHSLILAKWYKETIKNSLLSKVYVDKKLINGIRLEDGQLKGEDGSIIDSQSSIVDQIYNQYMEAYKKGVFNYIKEDYDRLSNETIPRKYFSGGIDKLANVPLRRSSSPVEESKNPKYKMGVGISPQGGKSDILTILAKMSKTARALALAAAITCTGAGCADRNDNSVKDVQVKQEVYFYRTDPNSEREYSEVQTSKNITLRVAGLKQEMFSGEWEVPLLVTSKKAFNKIHLVYQSGSGGIIAHRVNEYNLKGNFWRTEREVEIPFINGMNSVTLEFLDKNNQVVGFFDIRDFVDRLIQQNILSEKSRQIYLDFQKDKSSSPVRYEVYQADGSLREEDIQDFDSRLKAMWDEKNQAGIMKNNVFLINRSEKGDFFITFKAGDPATPISQERKEQSRVVKKDFNPEGFNFNKSFTIAQRLFELDLDGSRARVQVNIGPDFQHHFLVLPEAEKNHPQLIQPGHILTILKLLALSTADNIKFGHNSWGAGAAVNHLHIHGIYHPKGAFSIERAATRHIVSKASVNISEIVDYPAKGFVFESEKMSALAEVSGGFIKSLQDQNIPYNIVISRRGVYVLPREFGPTVIDGQELMLGYLEMAGEVGLPKDAFEHLSSLSQSQVQQLIADALWNATINNETFGELKKQLQSSSPILTDVVLPVLGIGIGTGILVKIWLDKTIQGNLLKLSAINTQASKNAFDKLVSFGYEALPAVEKRMQKVEDFARRLDRDNPLYQSSVDEYAVLSLLRDAIVQGKYKSSSPIFGGLFGSSKFQGEIIITDKAWKKAVLLLKVMESAQDGGKSLQSVQSKSLDWLGPQNSFKRTVALNVLRFLYKKGLINVDSSLRGQILTLLRSDSSVAVKLAALDFLGVVGMSFNPLDDLSPMDVSKIVKFREIILKKGNDSRKYESLEVFLDIKRLSSGEQNENDPQKLLNKIILEVEREGVPAQSSSPITPQEAEAKIKGKLAPEHHHLINDTHVDLAMAYEGDFEAVYHPGPPESIEIVRGEKLDQSSSPILSREIQILTEQEMRIVKEFRAGGTIHAISKNRRYVIAGKAGRGYIFDVETGRRALRSSLPAKGQEINHKLKGISAAQFSDDIQLAAIGYEGGPVHIYKLAGKGPVTVELEGHTEGITAIEFTPDRKFVVTASRDNTVRVWETATGRQLVNFNKHTNWVKSVQTLAGERQVVTAGWDGFIRRWDMETGNEISALKTDVRHIEHARVSPDGDRAVVTAGNDAVILDARTGEELVKLRGQDDAFVHYAEFSPDGRFVVTSGSDAAVRIWESATGLELAVLKGFKSSQWKIAVYFSADGENIIALGDGNMFKIWNVAKTVVSGSSSSPVGEISQLKSRLEGIERRIGKLRTEEIEEKVGRILDAARAGKVILRDKQVDILKHAGKSAVVVGQMDRSIAEAFGYVHQTVNAMVLTPDLEKVVLIRRAPHTTPYPFHLTIPGGHPSSGETEEEGIAIRLKDELGLSSLEGKLREVRTYAYGFDEKTEKDKTKERRKLFIYQLTQEEYESVLEHNRQYRQLAQEGEGNLRQVVEGERRAGRGDVWSYHEVGLDEIEGAAAAVDAESPYANKETRFIEAEDIVSGENIRQFFTPDLLDHLLDNANLVSRIKYDIGRMERGEEAAAHKKVSPYKRLVFLGPLASGKSTQAETVAVDLGVPHISVGELLRDILKFTEGGHLVAENKREYLKGIADTLGKEDIALIQERMQRGQLIENALTDKIVQTRLSQDDAREGFVLDGYPREESSAKALEDFLARHSVEVDRYVHINVSESVSRGRLDAGNHDRDDRSDDKDKEAREERLRVFDEETLPVLASRKDRVVEIDGDQPQDYVTDEIMDALFVSSQGDEDLGGIDMNAIDLDRQGEGVDIQFDPVELQELIDLGIDGFAPVIINITPLPSVLPLLGLEPANKEEGMEMSRLD